MYFSGGFTVGILFISKEEVFSKQSQTFTDRWYLQLNMNDTLHIKSHKTKKQMECKGIFGGLVSVSVYKFVPIQKCRSG